MIEGRKCTISITDSLHYLICLPFFAICIRVDLIFHLLLTPTPSPPLLITITIHFFYWNELLHIHFTKYEMDVHICYTRFVASLNIHYLSSPYIHPCFPPPPIAGFLPCSSLDPPLHHQDPTALHIRSLIEPCHTDPSLLFPYARSYRGRTRQYLQEGD